MVTIPTMRAPSTTTRHPASHQSSVRYRTHDKKARTGPTRGRAQYEMSQRAARSCGEE